MADFDYGKLSVAVDIGSFNVKGAVGYFNEEGVFKCVTIESVESSGISHGYVKNIEAASGCVKTLLLLLQNRLYSKIKRSSTLANFKIDFDTVYVSVSGAYTQGVSKVIERNLPHNTEVTTELIQEMERENTNFAQTGYAKYNKDFLLSIPQRYILDGFEEENPVGCLCSHLSVEFQNVIVRENAVANIHECFRRAGCSRVNIMLSAMNMSDVILTEQELSDGVALVDFGGDTISVSVFQKNTMKYIYVLPKGSEHITKDLEDLKMSGKDARKIKHRLCAMPYMEDSFNFNMTVYGEVHTYQSDVISGIIEQRMNKFLNQISEVLSVTLAGRQLNQIVLVGGGANLRFIKEKFEESLGIATRLGYVRGKEECNEARTYASLLSALYHAGGHSVVLTDLDVQEQETASSSVEKNESIEERKPKKKGFFKKSKQLVEIFTGTLFNDPTSDPQDKLE